MTNSEDKFNTYFLRFTIVLMVIAGIGVLSIPIIAVIFVASGYACHQ